VLTFISLFLLKYSMMKITHQTKIYLSVFPCLLAISLYIVVNFHVPNVGNFILYNSLPKVFVKEYVIYALSNYRFFTSNSTLFFREAFKKKTGNSLVFDQRGGTPL
jgi:hypothetical protein